MSAVGGAANGFELHIQCTGGKGEGFQEALEHHGGGAKRRESHRRLGETTRSDRSFSKVSGKAVIAEIISDGLSGEIVSDQPLFLRCEFPSLLLNHVHLDNSANITRSLS